MIGLIVVQIIICLTIILLILLQTKGSGLGSTFGGSGNVYQTKKGVEKAVFYLTIALVVLLALLAITNLKI